MECRLLKKLIMPNLSDLMQGHAAAEIICAMRGIVVRRLVVCDDTLEIDASGPWGREELAAPLATEIREEPSFWDRSSVVLTAGGQKIKLCCEHDIIRYEDGTQTHVVLDAIRIYRSDGRVEITECHATPGPLYRMMGEDGELHCYDWTFQVRTSDGRTLQHASHVVQGALMGPEGFWVPNYAHRDQVERFRQRVIERGSIDPTHWFEIAEEQLAYETADPPTSSEAPHFDALTA